MSLGYKLMGKETRMSGIIEGDEVVEADETVEVVEADEAVEEHGDEAAEAEVVEAEAVETTAAYSDEAVEEEVELISYYSAIVLLPKSAKIPGFGFFTYGALELVPGSEIIATEEYTNVQRSGSVSRFAADLLVHRWRTRITFPLPLHLSLHPIATKFLSSLSLQLCCGGDSRAESSFEQLRYGGAALPEAVLIEKDTLYWVEGTCENEALLTKLSRTITAPLVLWVHLECSEVQAVVE